MRKWAAHRDSVTPYEKFRKVLFTQNFSSLISHVTFSLTLCILMTVQTKIIFSQESSNNVILLGVGFGLFYEIVNYLQKSDLNFFFGGEIGN